MRSAKQTPSDLYELLTGLAWSDLAEAVRRFHGPTCPARCRGSVRIKHADSYIASVITRVLSLPAPAECVAAELLVTHEKGRHKWSRMLGNRTLVTTQSTATGGLLAERFGPLEFSFKLLVKDAGLHFQQNEVRFRLAGAGVPMPRWASPKISALCEGAGSGSRVRIWVQVEAPLLGVLLSYEGCFERDEKVL